MKDILSGGCCIGLCAETEGELQEALVAAEKNHDKLILIEACIGQPTVLKD